MKKGILLLFGILLPCILLAAQDLYQFSSPQEQQRFNHLTKELRCLVCQNQTLAESNAPLANDLRQQIYKKVRAGEDNKTIIDYLVSRYGNFILYEPPFNFATLGLWLGPIALLVMGLMYLFYYLRKHRE